MIRRGWNFKYALVLWTGIFLGFGPAYWLIFDSTFNSTVFANSPFLYSMFQGLFMATFTVGFVYLALWLIKRIKPVRQT